MRYFRWFHDHEDRKNVWLDFRDDTFTESVDSLCRDGTDTPYTVIQAVASRNLLRT